MPEARVKLVVTGDDFGYCARRNRGIVEVFRAGGLSAVSLLVNGAGAKDAAELAKRYRAFITFIHNITYSCYIRLSPMADRSGTYTPE